MFLEKINELMANAIEQKDIETVVILLKAMKYDTTRVLYRYKKAFELANKLENDEVRSIIDELLSEWKLRQIAHHNIFISKEQLKERLEKDYVDFDDNVCHYIKYHFGSTYLHDMIVHYQQKELKVKTQVLKDIICELVHKDKMKISLDLAAIYKDVILEDVLKGGYTFEFVKTFSQVLSGVDFIQLLDKKLLCYTTPKAFKIGDILKICSSSIQNILPENKDDIMRLTISNILNASQIEDLRAFIELEKRGIFSKTKITLSELDDLFVVLGINFSCVDFIETYIKNEKMVQMLHGNDEPIFIFEQSEVDDLLQQYQTVNMEETSLMV